MSLRRMLCFMVLGMSACNGGRSSLSQNPPPTISSAPAISSISPANTTAGGAGFALTVNGINFISGANVRWTNPGDPGFVGGPATFVSASQVTLQVSAANIAIPGTVQVTVLDPNGTPISNAVGFAINPGPAGSVRMISTGANGAVPNGASHDPVLNFNGRFVVFASEATNLINPNTKFPQGYVRDTCIGTDSCTPLTLLVSSVTGGTAGSPTEGNALGGLCQRSALKFSCLRPAPEYLPPAGSLASCLPRPISLRRIPLFSRLLCETLA